MDIRKLQRAIVNGLEDVKAQNIVVLNTEHLSTLFERVIVASGTSSRHAKSLAASVREAVKSTGLSTVRLEGETNGEWIIIDCGTAVVHVMQPVIREYYRLEEIWGGKPVNIKLNTRSTALVKASEPETTAAATATPKVAAKKVAAQKSVAQKKAPAAKTTRSTAPVKKIAAKKTPAAKRPAQKTAPLRAGVTRVVGLKNEGATNATTSSIDRASAPTRKMAVKKTAPRKTTSRAG